ncbi:MAG: DUF3857 domain-containing protein [Chitinophagales bacterium]
MTSRHMKIVLLLTFIACTAISHAQRFQYYNYTWKDTLQKFELSEYESKKPVVVLKEKRVTELVVDKIGVITFELKHTIKKVHTDHGIEKSNRVYIYEGKRTEILVNKLRVINPNGTIVELTKEDIQEAVDETTKSKYKYYAVKGLEIGSIIEELVVSKSSASLNGKIIPVQTSDYKKNVEIEIIYPSFLKFEVKSYNGLPKAIIDDTLYEKKIVHRIIADSIEELEDEKYSNYNANLKYLAYKLIANKAANSFNLNSFNSIAETLHGIVHKELDKKSDKALKEYISKFNFPENSTLDDSIKIIEHAIKLDIVYVEDMPTENENLAQMLQTKKANEQDLTILYENIFKQLGIKSQVVITNNRFSYPFDHKFENVNQLEAFLSYFPDTKKFLCPAAQSSRYPNIPYGYGSNYGLLIKTQDIGGTELVVKELKKIELPSDYGKDSLDITYDFTESMSQPKTKIVSTLFGHDAENFQFAFSFVDDKQKREMLESYIKNYCGETDLEYMHENGGKENLGQTPFIVSAEFSSNKLLERNGENIILKLGESIGPQAELYQEKERAMPIEMPFPHTYKRHFKVIIPAEYEYNNLEALSMSHELKEGNKVSSAFYSNYKVEGNILYIDVAEFYSKTNYPKSDYPAFKNVINAAADFNKIKIILTKKG